jgi:hypothetical protein
VAEELGESLLLLKSDVIHNTWLRTFVLTPLKARVTRRENYEVNKLTDNLILPAHNR